jgi:hypothetical protein
MSWLYRMPVVSLPVSLQTVDRQATARLLRQIRRCKNDLLRKGEHALSRRVTRVERSQ